MMLINPWHLEATHRGTTVMVEMQLLQPLLDPARTSERLHLPYFLHF
jgi:hypothetical protein